nr:MAG TPA: DNA replication licensing factor MCM2 replication, Cryo-EM, OCCM, REPLICATION [Caudoviricetes sp.]
MQISIGFCNQFNLPHQKTQAIIWQQLNFI